MRLIARYGIPVHAGDNIGLADGKTYIAVTFDDGYQGILDNAVPEMASLKIPYTIFIPTKYLGKRSEWNPGVTENDLSDVIINAKQLEQMTDDLVTIGSHSDSHPDFTKLSTEEAIKEFNKSKQILENICRKKIQLFSFPFGEHNQKLIEQAQELGYKRMFTIKPSVCYAKFNMPVIGRFAVNPFDSILEFRLKISGAYIWMVQISLLKRKIKSFLNELKYKLKNPFPEKKTRSELS